MIEAHSYKEIRMGADIRILEAGIEELRKAGFEIPTGQINDKLENKVAQAKVKSKRGTISAEAAGTELLKAILSNAGYDNSTSGDVDIYEDSNKENQHPELKLERILNELEEIYPSLSDYPQFKEGLDLLTNVYNEYMDYSDEIPNSI